MKKRFPAIVLALALCLGLTVPAFAAAPEITLDLPRGSTAAEKTDTYQILHITSGKTEDGKDALVYAGKPSSETLTVTPLPLGASVTISHIASPSVILGAFSDPDGDGVYQERIFFWQANTAYNTNDYSVGPLTAKGPFAPLGLNGYVASPPAKDLGFRLEGGSNDSEYALTTTSDALYEIFGSNTLIRITAQWGSGEAMELACLLLTGESAPAPVFTDVPGWCADAVSWAAQEGITNGTTAATFSPSQGCTRVQILTFLWRAAGEPKSDAKLAIDITGKNIAYAEGALRWAAALGLIDESFDAGVMCTRADAVNYIWRVFDRPGAESAGFTDVAQSAAYAAAVSWAVENGVTNGKTTDTFAPDEVCTRGEIVTFLHRAYVEEARLAVD